MKKIANFNIFYMLMRKIEVHELDSGPWDRAMRLNGAMQ